MEFRPASHKENPKVKISLCTLIYCCAVLWCEAWLSRHKYYRFLLIGGAFSASFILCPFTPDCYIPTSNQQIAVYQHSSQSQYHQCTCQISTKLSKGSWTNRETVQPARKKTHQWKLVCAHWCIALMWGKHFLSSPSQYCFPLIAGKYYTCFMLCLWTVDCHILNSNQQIAVHQHSDQSQSYQWSSQITTKLPQELNSRLFWYSQHPNSKCFHLSKKTL